MSRWKNNAPYPGTQLADGRFIPPGLEFIVPDDTPARELWLPLDAAAHEAVERAKAATEEYVREQATQAGQQGVPQQRTFRTVPERVDPKHPSPEGLPDKDEIVMSPTTARKTL